MPREYIDMTKRTMTTARAMGPISCHRPTSVKSIDRSSPGAPLFATDGAAGQGRVVVVVVFFRIDLGWVLSFVDRLFFRLHQGRLRLHQRRRHGRFGFGLRLFFRRGATARRGWGRGR